MGFSDYFSLALACATAVLAMLLADNQWARDHQWLVPVLWVGCVIALFSMLFHARWFRRLFGSQEPSTQEAFTQNIQDSRVSGDVRMVGEVGGHYIESLHIHDNPTPAGELTLEFDPEDEQCVRRENGIPREYRLRVTNTTGQTAHDVCVVIGACQQE
jgi:hypothetical protein